MIPQFQFCTAQTVAVSICFKYCERKRIILHRQQRNLFSVHMNGIAGADLAVCLHLKFNLCRIRVSKRRRCLYQNVVGISLQRALPVCINSDQLRCCTGNPTNDRGCIHARLIIYALLINCKFRPRKFLSGYHVLFAHIEPDRCIQHRLLVDAERLLIIFTFFVNSEPLIPCQLITDGRCALMKRIEILTCRIVLIIGGNKLHAPFNLIVLSKRVIFRLGFLRHHCFRLRHRYEERRLLRRFEGFIYPYCAFRRITDIQLRACKVLLSIRCSLIDQNIDRSVIHKERMAVSGKFRLFLVTTCIVKRDLVLIADIEADIICLIVTGRDLNLHKIIPFNIGSVGRHGKHTGHIKCTAVSIVCCFFEYPNCSRVVVQIFVIVRFIVNS